MHVIKSLSNYSFKSSQLEAVEEGSSNSSIQMNEVDDDHENEDIENDALGVERLSDEKIPMINMNEKGRIENGRRLEKNDTERHLKKLHQNGMANDSNIDERKPIKAGTEERDIREDEMGVIGRKSIMTKRKKQLGTDKITMMNNSSPFKSKRSVLLKRRYPWLSSACLPNRAKTAKQKQRNVLKDGTDNVLGGHGSVPNHQDGTRLYNFNKNGISDHSISHVRKFVDGSRPISEDTQITILVQDEMTESRPAEKRRIPGDAAGFSLFVKNSDAQENKMSHSISSPALATATTHEHTRRGSSPAALHKESKQLETRPSRISQIALQARRKVSQALTASSSENMCTASVKRMKQTRRTLRMFTCVVVVFAVCILPNQVTWIWMAFNGAHLNHVVYTVFYFLTYTNSVINPWIYGAVNPSFRKAYRKVFCCQPHSDFKKNNPRRSSSKITYLWTSRRGSDVTNLARNRNPRLPAPEKIF